MVHHASQLLVLHSRRHAPSPSFASLYEREFGFVWRVVQRLGIAAEIDDVVREVFLTVYRRLAEFEPRCSLRTWIFGIVRRVVAAHRPRERESFSALLPASGPSQRLEEVLDRLDAKKREVFILADLEGMAIAEVAEALDMTLYTAEWRLRAARRELEYALERAEERPEGAAT